jgi:hypothetical protein
MALGVELVPKGSMIISREEFLAASRSEKKKCRVQGLAHLLPKPLFCSAFPHPYPAPLSGVPPKAVSPNHDQIKAEPSCPQPFQSRAFFTTFSGHFNFIRWLAQGRCAGPGRGWKVTREGPRHSAAPDPSNRTLCTNWEMHAIRAGVWVGLPQNDEINILNRAKGPPSCIQRDKPNILNSWKGMLKAR